MVEPVGVRGAGGATSPNVYKSETFHTKNARQIPAAISVSCSTFAEPLHENRPAEQVCPRKSACSEYLPSVVAGAHLLDFLIIKFNVLVSHEPAET